MEITITKKKLPKKGLSSSEVICVLISTAVNLLYNLRLSVEDVIGIVYSREYYLKLVLEKIRRSFILNETMYNVGNLDSYLSTMKSMCKGRC